MVRSLIILLIVVSYTQANPQLQKDIQDFHRTFKDMGGGAFSFNPSPFFCNSAPQFVAPCAQPAIPICCGPCFQSGGQIAQPGGAQNPPVAGGPGTAPGGGPATGPGTGPAPSAPPPPPGTPFVPPPTAAAPAPTEAPAPVPAGTGAPVAPAAGSTPAVPNASTGNCPIACPAGWNQWGITENCYLMPPQPAKLDTFWNQEAFCKQSEPTSYIMVIDGLMEQALGSAVAFQYAANWLALGTNGFLWMGGWADGTKWNYLDGTDQSGNILMTAANLLGGKGNGTCIGADPKTLGLWQSRPCSDTTGAVICEMPKRPVCGATGGQLPISPISLTPDSLKNLFPKMPSIPFLGQLLGGNTGAPGSGILGGLLGSAAELN